MSLAEMIEDGFPHGTVKGYEQGCRGGICPAPLSCKDFTVRWKGDYGFRKQILAGDTVDAILKREKTAQAEPVAPKRTTKVRKRQEQSRSLAAAQKRELVRGAHTKGCTNEQIVTDTGLSLYVVKHALMHLGLSANRKKIDRPDLPHGTWRRYLRGANGEPGCRDNCPSTPTCRQAANLHRWQNKQKAAA